MEPMESVNAETNGETCPLCAEASDILFADNSGRESIRRCSACGVAFRNEPPSATSAPREASDVEEVVEDVLEAAPALGRFEPLIASLGHRLRRARARRLARGIVAGRALDVGCGRGRTLRALMEAGWTVVGVEIDPASAAEARARGLTVHEGALEDQRFDDASFDLVTLFRVLEEMPRPHETLREIHRILRPGGRLIVSVPNFGKLQEHLFGKEWLHVKEKRERYFFDERSLHRLLETTGFAPQDERHFSLEDSPLTWLQSAENLALRNHNLLYRMLRHHSQPASQPSTTARVAAVSAGVLLGPAAATASIVAAAVGFGDVLEVMATRR